MVAKKTCPVCRSEKITNFLSRELVPVYQNMVFESQELAVGANRGNLRLACCEECGFIFNQSFELAMLDYDNEYDNAQHCSPSFDKYLDKLLHYLIVEKGIKNSRIVEVGCGQGYFLRKLVEIEKVGNYGYGFDPSYRGASFELDGRLRFEKRYYDAECSNIPADVVICRHVIEHITEPLELLKSVRQALANSPKALVFFETPCAKWIMKNQTFWDLFYEHCSYFTAESLTTAFETSGFQVEAVKNVFGGQYLWLEATVSDKKPIDSQTAGVILSLVQQFSKSEKKYKQTWQLKIQELAAKEKIAIWGAGAKGVTFANLIDPSCKLISCVVDINPNKQGNYLPGTGHPILSYQELAKLGVTYAIVMNQNYFKEIENLLQSANLSINLLEASYE
ncbi:MAG: class I SAM-dependent methyltransferase [Trichodesmium sp. MAG_R03]|nr:class I SAM-dependent methyltransferase [Trichodesmium sp. MAG_R03]